MAFGKGGRTGGSRGVAASGFRRSNPRLLWPRPRRGGQSVQAIRSYLTLGLVALAFPATVGADDLPALRIRGTKFVDEKGAPVQLRGVNLGCWLLPESHFLGMEFRDEK